MFIHTFCLCMGGVERVKGHLSIKDKTASPNSYHFNLHIKDTSPKLCVVFQLQTITIMYA